LMRAKESVGHGLRPFLHHLCLRNEGRAETDGSSWSGWRRGDLAPTPRSGQRGRSGIVDGVWPLTTTGSEHGGRVVDGRGSWWIGGCSRWRS
jgi:hypothetical protein